MFVVYRPSNRIAVIGSGWLMVAAGVVVAVVSLRDVHPFTSRFWSLVGGVCLVVVGVAATLYCEPLRRYVLRLGWFFGGAMVIAVGAGAIYYLLTENPHNKVLPLVSGAVLIMVGIFVAMYSGSVLQWRRRLWLTGLGLLVLAAGVLAAGSIAVVVAVGAAQNPSSGVPAYYGVAVVVIASVSLVGAVIAFAKAWRTPEQPARRPRWHQIGR